MARSAGRDLRAQAARAGEAVLRSVHSFLPKHQAAPELAGHQAAWKRSSWKPSRPGLSCEGNPEKGSVFVLGQDEASQSPLLNRHLTAQV